jgi:hypothetical protein
MAERKSPITLEAGADVATKRLVKLSSGTMVHNTETETDDPIGVNDYSVSSGEVGAVKLLSEDGTQEMTAAGAIDQDADVYAADDGKIQALPVGAGTYRKIGKAMEAATADGDIVEVLPYDFHATTTVS